MSKLGKIGRFAGACVFAGPVAAILAPLLVFFALLMTPGQYSLGYFDIITMAGLGFLIGLGVGLVFGLPALLLLDIYGLNKPVISACVGAALSCVILFAIGPNANEQYLIETRLLYFYVGAIGAACGAVVSYLSLREL